MVEYLFISLGEAVNICLVFQPRAFLHNLLAWSRRETSSAKLISPVPRGGNSKSAKVPGAVFHVHMKTAFRVFLNNSQWILALGHKCTGVKIDFERDAWQIALEIRRNC